MKKQYAIIGLGRFGGSLCQEFYDIGLEVLVIDNDEDKVNKYASLATHAVHIDGTDEGSLLNLGIRNCDYVIVAIGEDIQASILTTLLLKELGVKQVWVKAQNEYHHKVLEKIGADKIIHPEREMAKKVVHHIVSEKIIDFIELSEEYSIVELSASDKVANQSLVELDTRAKFGCTIVAIKNGDNINVSPSADTVIRKDDILVVIGHNSDVSRFEKLGI